MELKLAGYFPKLVVSVPDWLHAAGVADVCSVSSCISTGPAGWIDHWLHNDLGWFDTPELAAQVIPRGATGFRVFAYRVLGTRYRGGVAEGWEWPPVRPAPLDSSFHSAGFDAVSKSLADGLGFECSPLSCCDLAAGGQVNEHCLMNSFEVAVATAQRFSLEEPEPGPYYVVEVLERPSA
ncbi:MAG: hypothetical protein ACREKQ_11160 [Candidatus Rokuibacteriota bacterium]